ncbi:MAG TPA: hypothetical protein ENH44_00505, partial [Actinobacteria bacterium]|nr:hypothetical protein [Actinomycetota bacterium]
MGNMRIFMSTFLGILIALLLLFQNLALASTPVQVTSSSANQGRPDISGNTIVWKDLRAGNWDIYRYNISSGSEAIVADTPAYQNLPVTSGLVVVWQDNRAGDNDLYMKDLVLGLEQPLVTGPGNQGLPSISGTHVAYVDDSSGSNDIYVIDLATRTSQPVCTDPASQWQPRISNSRVVWQDNRNGKWDIYMNDIDDPIPNGEPLVAGPGEHMVSDISGNRVVWQEHADGQYDIYMKAIGGAELPLTSDTAYQSSPRISGDLVVWEDYRNGNWDIFMLDLTSGKESPLATGPSNQARPALDRETVVWEQDNAAGDYNIWMIAVPDITPPAISGLNPAADSTGVCPSPTISATLSDNRTGLDPGSVVLLFDGMDVTGDASLTDTAITYQPGVVADGDHTVSLTAADYAGNIITREWQFQTSRPELTIPWRTAFWGSYGDYTSGILSVNFTLKNSATGTTAVGVQALVSPASSGVMAVGLPSDPVDIDTGEQALVLVRYLIPPGVTGFTTTVYIGCSDTCGGQY